MTEVEHYVKQYFPDAYHYVFHDDVWIFSNKKSSKKSISLGQGYGIKEAWEDAKQWIDSLPEDQKPKIK